MRTFLFGLLSLLASIGIAKADCALDSEKSRISRVVAVDSTGGPAYPATPGSSAENAVSAALSLGDKEIALIFAGGPQIPYTTYILHILDRHCIKATFFFTGQKAAGSQKLIQEVERRGHTIAAGRWSDARGLAVATPESAKIDIEKSFMAIQRAVGKPIAPFFRFSDDPGSPEAVSYLASRNISAWSADILSGDTNGGATATKVANQTLSRVGGKKKGVILFSDTRKVTVDALDSILNNLKKDGYRVVHLVPSTFYTPNPELVALQKDALIPQAALSPRTRNLVKSAKRRVRPVKRAVERDAEEDGQDRPRQE